MIAQGASGTATLGVTVRVGVFFDGTGNNRSNSQIGADCRAMAEISANKHIAECGGRHSDPNSSYSNDLSNIARLADLYCNRPVASNLGDGLKVYWPIYVSGIGTLSGGVIQSGLDKALAAVEPALFPKSHGRSRSLGLS